jgi:serine kinase of HPr protein (carbohydrate metabolism regulator)
MKVKEFRNSLKLEVVAGSRGLEKEIRDGYCGDLLSDVMANAKKGAVWVTVQSHQNVIAVALLRELSAIVLVNSRSPEEMTKAKAEEEGIPLMTSPLSAYEIAGKLYELGIGKART